MEKKYMAFHGHLWGRSIIWATGGKVAVTGLENIPEHQAICFVSNHQGGLDIPLIMGYIYPAVGFIAKSELRYVPILSSWMKVLHCIFINRKNSRESLDAVNRGVEYIKKGFPIVIFPEGTRSRSKKMAPFKSGSLKLAIRSKAQIIPMTIDGSYKLKEEKKWLITPATVKITVHPPVDTASFKDEDTKGVATRLWNTIHSALIPK